MNNFIDIQTFIIGYFKLLKTINESHKDIMTLKLGDNVFPLPATFNQFSQRADDAQKHLQWQIRGLAQQRRYEISKGMDDQYKSTTFEKISYIFDENFRNELNQLGNNISNGNIRAMFRHIRVILDSFELYNDIISTKGSSNITFRIIPILQNIKKQVRISFMQLVDS